MSLASRKLDDYLRENICNKNDTQKHTHTRIGDKELKIKGGSYLIENEVNFLEMYYDKVLKKNEMEYLTEKQLDFGPIAVDIDIRYSKDIKERQHDENDIIDIIDNYSRWIGNLFKIENKFEFEIFIMHKPNVNCLDSKTKDGIHLIIGINVERAVQILLREKVMEELLESWVDSLPIIDYDDLIDSSVTKGLSNWQLYGSRKPGNEAYKLTHHYKLIWEEDRDGFKFKKQDIDKFNLKKDLKKLSVRNLDNPTLEIKDEFLQEIEKIKNVGVKKNKSTKKLIMDTEDEKIDPWKIKTMELQD